jgi:small neutral amino acid transporter SnatA (MarC family)
MHDVISFALVAFPSLIVIINPVMVTSVFITLTSNATPQAKRASFARRPSLPSLFCGVESVLPELAAVMRAAPRR